MNWLLIFVILCIGLFGFIGYHRGLIKSLFSTLATIIALVLSYFLTPVVADLLQNKTGMGKSIEDKIYTMVEERVQDTVGGSVAQTRELMMDNPDKQKQVTLIKDLSIPDYLEEELLANNNAQGYKELGVDNVYRYIAKSVARVIICIIAGAITFILIRLLLILAVMAISSAVNHFAILRMVDKTGGIIAGVVLGLIVVWLVMFVCSLLMKGDSYTALLKDNAGLQWLNDHNVLMKMSLK